MVSKIIFTIVVYCLPELLALSLLGLISYVVCVVTDRKSIGLMAILLTIFCGIDIALTKISGLISKLIDF